MSVLRARIGTIFGDSGAAFLLVLVLVVLLALFAPGFATSGNLANVGRIAAILALAACGQGVVIITRGLDLSSGSIVALMSVVAIQQFDLGVGLAFALAFLAALGVGALNGLLVGRFGIPAFLVTLGTLTGVQGLASYMVGGISVQAPASSAFRWLSNGEIGPVPVPVALAVGALLVLSLVLHRSKVGRSWYLIGSNPEASEMAGLKVRWLLFWAYVAGAAFVALAGLVLTARVSSAQPNLYPTLAFEAIAACAIGGFSLSGGNGRVSGVVAGVLVVSLTTNGLILLNVPDNFQTIVIGVIIITAVLIGRRRDAGRDGWPTSSILMMNRKRRTSGKATP